MYSSNIHEPIAPASLTKIMTAVILLDNYDINDYIEVKIINNDIKGKIAYIESNQSMKVSTLLDFLLVYSANDAAHVAALAVSETESEFIDLMNSKASYLGMSNTNYSNVHGLDDDAHYTTLNDLLILTLESIKYDAIIASVRKDSFVASINNNIPTTYKTTNDLILYNQNYIGLKTGWTSKAGLTLIALYQESNRNVLTIVNKSEVNQDKTNHFNDTEILTLTSINNYKLMNIVSRGEVLLNIYSGQGYYPIYSTVEINEFDNIKVQKTINLESIDNNQAIYTYHDNKQVIVSIPKSNKISILNSLLFWLFK